LPPSDPEHIARRYGLALRALPGGVANDVYALGDELILRIARSASFGADLAKEALVIPAAVAAGVLTPSIVEFGNGFMVVRRVPGTDFAVAAAYRSIADPATARLWRSVGAELAKLHRVTSVDGLSPAPADPGDPIALVEELAGSGWLDSSAAEWLDGWFQRLAARRPASAAAVLIHGDIAPQNLMADPSTGALTGIVDWGDAALDDPAADFAKLPLWAVVPALSGYLGDADASMVEEWAARILWIHLHWGLARLRDPAPAPSARHWTAPPAGRLLGLLRFFASGPPAPWSALT
jgi:aminoglycoside phosphotransferase (APT) family kinase protein